MASPSIHARPTPTHQFYNVYYRGVAPQSLARLRPRTAANARPKCPSDRSIGFHMLARRFPLPCSRRCGHALSGHGWFHCLADSSQTVKFRRRESKSEDAKGGLPMHDYRAWGGPRGQQPMIFHVGGPPSISIGNLDGSLPGSVVWNQSMLPTMFWHYPLLLQCTHLEHFVSWFGWDMPIPYPSERSVDIVRPTIRYSVGFRSLHKVVLRLESPRLQRVFPDICALSFAL